MIKINQKEMKVSALENGTVIDHIPTNKVFQVVKILGLEKTSNQMTLGINLDSKKIGKKGIIKISNKFFEPIEIHKISIVAPHATLTIIKNFEVIQKFKIEIPDEFEGIIKCFNPKCITNNQNVMQRFSIADKENLMLKCHFCEKYTKKENIEFL